MALNVSATTAEGKQLSSDKVHIASHGVAFALVSPDGHHTALRTVKT
jgi:hypothetical protein